MYQKQVSFQDAVTRALKFNYCNFGGRASRSEYWWFILFEFIVGAIIGIAFSFNSTVCETMSGIVNLALLLPGLGLAVRRLHDIGKSAWWIFIVFIPLVGWIIYLVWMCKDSEPYPNMYGPVPNMAE